MWPFRLLRHKHLLRSATSLVLAFVMSFLPVLPTANGIDLFGALSTKAMVEHLQRLARDLKANMPAAHVQPRVAAARLQVGEGEPGTIAGDEDAVFVVELDQQDQKLTLAVVPSSPEEVASRTDTPMALEVTPTPSVSPDSDPQPSAQPTPEPSPEEPTDEVAAESPAPSPLVVPLVPLVVPSSTPEATASPTATPAPLTRVLNLPLFRWLRRAEALAAIEAAPPAELVITDAVVTGPNGEVADVAPVFDQVNGTTVVRLPRHANAFHPGRYHVAVTLEDTAAGATYELTQDFTWGVLAMNFDKSSYAPGAEALIGIGVIDDQGRTVCRAELTLSITQPDGTTITRSTADSTVTISDQCGGSSETYLPDYSATYTPPDVGEYRVELTATTENGTRTISDHFTATNNAAVVVERDGAPGTLMAASRIYPPTDYMMSINITNRAAFTGSITETVPSSFKISQAKLVIESASGTQVHDVAVQEAGDRQMLVSPVVTSDPTDLVTLTYTYDAPDVSPELYLLGPLELSERGTSKYPEPVEGYPAWHEPRAWQIAADATKYWVGGNGDNVGTNANDWSTTDPTACNDGGGDAAAVPGSADVATFDADCDSNATIAATWDVRGIDIKSGYIGTITQNDMIAVTVGAGNYAQADGTFTGATTSGDIDVNGTWALSGGTFTSTKGTLSVSSTFTISGAPTFTHNSGTVQFDTSAATITPATATLNNVSFTSAVTKTMANSQTMTVAGTLTLTDGSISQTTIPAGGSIAAQGGITQATAFDGGTGRIEINGTGGQTFTGGGSSTAGNLPDIEIDKASGTLTASSTIRTGNDWTWTAGTIDFTTNDTTVCFCTETDPDIIITGSHTLDNVIIEHDVAGGGQDVFVANSNTLTVAGTLTLTDGSIEQTTVPATGSIAAQGNITQASTFGDPGGSGGTGRIEINGTGGQTFTGGGSSSAGLLPDIEIDKASGTLTLSSIIRTNNNWTWTAGTVDATTNDSTVVFSADSKTITGSHSLDNVIFDSNDTGGVTNIIASGTTLTVVGTLTIDNTSTGLQAINTGTIAAQGSIVTDDTVHTASTATLLINGTANQTWTSSAAATVGGMLIVNIDKSSNALALSGIINTQNNWTWTAGTIDVTTNDSTVVFGATSKTITGSHTLDNVLFDTNTTNNRTWTIASGTTLTAAGNATIDNTSTGTISLNTGTLAVQGNLTTTTEVGDTSTAAIQLTGGNNQTINAAELTDGTFTVNKSGGTATLAAALPVSATGQDLTITAGTLDLAGFDLTVTDVFTLGASGTLQLQGGETVSTIDTVTAGSTVIYNGTGSYTTALAAGNTYSNLTFNGSGGVWEPSAAVTVNSNLTITNGTFDIDGQNLTVTSTFSNAGTLRLTGGETTVSLTNDTDSGTVEYDGTTSYTGLKAGNSYYHVIFNGVGGTWTQNATLDVNGNLTITAGTLASSANAITLAGNWSNSGTYTHGNNTVTLDGTNQTITGSSNTTFYNLTKSVTSAATLTFNNLRTTTIANTWTANGASGQLLSLRSDSAGTQWEIDPQGTRTVSYLDVKDSNNTNVTAVSCTTGCTNSGNNTNWTFGSTRQRLRIIAGAGDAKRILTNCIYIG